MKNLLHLLLRLYSWRGRARRLEYGIVLLVFIFGNYFLWSFYCRDAAFTEVPWHVSFAAFLLLCVPFFFAAVRRHHDFGRGGQWALMMFVPILGQIWMLVIAVVEPQKHDNDYGAYVPSADSVG